MGESRAEKKRGRGRNERAWGAADAALWHTLSIVASIENREVPEQRASTFFALQPNELAFAAGPFAIDSLRAAGDGSYVQNSSFVFGTGVLGAAMTLGTLAANAGSNAARRNRAIQDAQVMWRPDSNGLITVTNQGFYIQTHSGHFRWSWSAIKLAQMSSFSVLVFQGESARGPVTWRLTSDWAELIFALWALMVHPSHPQFVDGSWVPDNWIRWATDLGYPIPSGPSGSIRA